MNNCTHEKYFLIEHVNGVHTKKYCWSCEQVIIEEEPSMVKPILTFNGQPVTEDILNQFQ